MDIEEIKPTLEDLRTRVDRLKASMDIDTQKSRQTEIEKAMSAGDFWNDQERAQKIVGELKKIKSVVAPYSDMAQKLDDCEVMLEMAREENDADAMTGLATDTEKLAAAVGEFEFKAMLSGPHDANDAFMTITRARAAPSRATGPRCSCACTPAGWSATATTRASSTRSRATARAIAAS